MGSAELTRLWNLNADNMDACKDDKRVFLPNLEDFFGDVTTACPAPHILN
jgi:THO complex subunit 1